MGETNMKRIVSLILVVLLAFSASALAESTSDLRSMLDQGAAFVREQDFASAEICYDIAMKLSPDDPAVYSAIADMYLAAADYERSLESVDQALSLAPADGSLYLKRAQILFACDRIDEAELALRYAEICGAQAGSDLRIAAAVSYAESGRYAEAVERFDAVETEYWWAEYSELYGQALIRSGDRSRAAQLGLITVGVKDAPLEPLVRANPTIAHTECMESVAEYPVYFLSA